MLIKNGLVYTDKCTFENIDILIENGKITELGKICTDDKEIIDASGYIVSPGFIDIHFHGCNGYDICDNTKESLIEIAKYELCSGITSICPYTMTLEVEELQSILKNINEYINSDLNNKYSTYVGVNMEGPFISKKRKGAQDEKYILPCDIDIFDKLYKASGENIKIFGFAPEASDSDKFIEYAKTKTNLSIAHSDISYEDAKEAFNKGVNHVTHMYNAMRDISKRDPGVVLASYESPFTTCELIADGIHTHPSIVKMTIDLFKSDRIIIISDSMRATGLGDGNFTLGGLDVEVKNGIAHNKGTNTIAGGVNNLTQIIKRMYVDMKIKLEDIIKMATINPAKKLNIDNKVGSITTDKNADIIIFDKNIDIKHVIKNGVIVK